MTNTKLSRRPSVLLSRLTYLALVVLISLGMAFHRHSLLLWGCLTILVFFFAQAVMAGITRASQWSLTSLPEKAFILLVPVAGFGLSLLMGRSNSSLMVLQGVLAVLMSGILPVLHVSRRSADRLDNQPR